jgi:CheY-like chemotaxis protein
MPTVLFTDADRESREVYAWLPSSYGFEVETADDGPACLASLRRAVPDLLILDLKLPGGGGDGVLAILREDLQEGQPLVLVRAGTAIRRRLTSSIATAVTIWPRSRR